MNFYNFFVPRSASVVPINLNIDYGKLPKSVKEFIGDYKFITFDREDGIWSFESHPEKTNDLVFTPNFHEKEITLQIGHLKPKHSLFWFKHLGETRFFAINKDGTLVGFFQKPNYVKGVWSVDEFKGVELGFKDALVLCVKVIRGEDE